MKNEIKKNVRLKFFVAKRMESDEYESSLLREVQTRKYVSETTAKDFYNRLQVRRNEYSLLLNQFDEKLNLYQDEIIIKKKLKHKLKKEQANYALAYAQLAKRSNQNENNEFIGKQTKEEIMKKETLFKEMEAIKQNILFNKRQLEEDKTKYDLIIKKMQEKYDSIQKQVEILTKQLEIVNDGESNNKTKEINDKSYLKTCDLFPIPNTYQITKKI